MPTNDMKRKISQAYKELLSKKDSDKITVKDLISACEISRQTFYYHFKDIMDVLEWTMNDAMDTILSYSNKITDPEKFILWMIEDMYENRNVVLKICESKRIMMMQDKMIEAFMHLLAMLLKEKNKSTNINIEDMETVLRFYASGATMLMLHKCIEGNVDKEKLAHQLYQIAKGQLKLIQD